jgi:hypothetical protein
MFIYEVFEGNMISFLRRRSEVDDQQILKYARLSNCVWMKFLLRSKETKDKNGKKDQKNDFCERKIVVRDGPIEEVTEMSAEFCDENAVHLWIPDSISIVKYKSFHNFDRFLALSFESNSGLIRIESKAFYGSSLESIVIPSTVQILGSSCFSFCKSLSSLSFE